MVGWAGAVGVGCGFRVGWVIVMTLFRSRMWTYSVGDGFAGLGLRVRFSCNTIDEFGDQVCYEVCLAS